MAQEDEQKTCCCPCPWKQRSKEGERQPLLAEDSEPPYGGKPRETEEQRPENKDEKPSTSGEEVDGGKVKKHTKSKEIKFEKFQIAELDTLFDDFERSLNPFVTNRISMETAQASFKQAVASFTAISPKAKFREYVHALKTELKEANIFLKIKGGVMVFVSEAGKGIEAVRNAVTAVNRMLDAAKSLKSMPPTVERETEDALARTEEMDVMAILKREFKHWYDASKIIRYNKAFTKNVQMLQQTPQMVKEFCETTRIIVMEIMRAFADEEEFPSTNGSVSEKGDESEGEASRREEDKGEEEEKKGSEKANRKEEGEEKEEVSEKKNKEGNGEKSSAKKDQKKDKAADKEDFHKKLEFKVIGVQDIDRVFTDLAGAVNPFVVTREAIENARVAFENSVKSICNFEGKREFKEYLKEIEEKAKKGDITIYVDTSDGEIKVTSVKGLEPPKIYRDAVKALNNLKAAAKDALELEPDVQEGITACIEDISKVDPKSDIKKGLKFKDLPKLVGKVKDLNDNRKKLQQAPGIVKEFCQYLDGLITDILEVLVEGKRKEDGEIEDEAGEGSSDETESEHGSDKGEAPREDGEGGAEGNAEVEQTGGHEDEPGQHEGPDELHQEKRKKTEEDDQQQAEDNATMEK